ncbi:cell division septation protein DedD [Halanaerobacter jeridensis]|uniref:Cell division septation protein DedD n=2 Tax=Halanaerobacter jeridensis TaxID=706427 RepID=A0A939BP23_9FIRM|nr:cell division septation protein DedD [Halanaerobacter jeridensis]
MNKKNLKSGTSLLFMLGFMAVIASVFGYFISSWFLDYVTAPEEEINSVANNRTVKEEKIDPQQKEDSQSTASSIASDNSDFKSDTQEQKKEDEAATIKPQANSDLFAVQVGAFSKKDNAEGLVNKLQNKGFTAYITTKNPYRVQVGAFKTKEAAEELGKELQKIGFPVYINH